MIGSTVSHYRILEKLGGGGMGVVYKAEDTKLHRTVALKFLPAAFSFDEEAKQRFIHEAQTASVIQHNNICTVHDIDETEDGQMFICMDFYDGETLKKKIVNGPLTINEAIDITIQIAQGLLKAHEKGIIHRDIKPANIFITNEGIAKILDFGLAKLSDQTMITKMGSTPGTVAYMSPEQSRGEQVDIRTDIWSLGVVMYEMLMGERPFEGEYEQVIIYSILNKEPKQITGLRNDIPFELERIVNKCLEKDKEYRYQQIDDLLLDLRRAKRETSGVSIPIIDLKRTKTKVVEKIRTKNTKKYVWMSSGIFIFIAIVSAIIFWPSGSELQLNPNRIMRTLNLPNKQLMYPSISADGNWISYPAIDVNGDWNVYLTHSTSGEAPVSIINEKKSSKLIWSAEISPNGSHIIYDQSEPSILKIIPTFGGVTKNLDSLIRMGDIQWRPDGLRLGGIIFFKRHREFWTSSADGTDLRKEFVDTTTSLLFRNFDFAWSPDGKSVAWLRDFEEGSGYQEIITHNLETGNEKQITFAKSNIESLCWSPLNVIIFSATISGPLNLWMVPAEGGELTQITFGDGPDGPPRISMDGRLLIYPKIKMIGQIMIIPLSGGEPKLVSSGEYLVWGWGPLLSPDGKRIAMHIGDLRFGWSGARSPLYIMNRDGSQRYKISTGEWENVGIYSWSPDGKWIAFETNRFFNMGNMPDIYILNVTGNNQPKKITRVDKFLDLRWIDSLNLNIRTKDRFYRYNLVQDKIVEDSVFFYPIKGSSEVLIQHLDSSWWIRKGGKKQKIQQPDNVRLSLPNLCWYGWSLDIGFRKISIFDGKIKDYPIFKNVKFPAEIFGVLCNISDDGKEVIFATQEMQGQISIIENPFIIK